MCKNASIASINISTAKVIDHHAHCNSHIENATTPSLLELVESSEVENAIFIIYTKNTLANSE